MPNPSPRELFEAFFPDPVLAGKLALYTTTLRKGKDSTHWCFNLCQADRLCQSFRSTRRIRFGIGLQSLEQALAIAHERRPRATKRTIQGGDASVIALPALWVEIPYASAATASGVESSLTSPATHLAPLPPGRQQALSLLDAFEQRPSIAISTRSDTGGVIYAFWLLGQMWELELGDSAARNDARSLLRRFQTAVAHLASERGWSLGHPAHDAAPNLAASFPVPGFATGADSQGPRAVLEAFPLMPGDSRYRRQDFEYLPAPLPLDSQPWRDVLEPPTLGKPTRQIFDFGPIAEGCSWIRACRIDRANLGQQQLSNAVRLLSRCAAPGADSARLVHEVCDGHPGSDPLTTDRLLARELRAPGDPISCQEIGEVPGVVENHCAKCPSFGSVVSPLDLALETSKPSYGPSSHGPAIATANNAEVSPGGPRTEAKPTVRHRILITSRQHEVNDQALAALAVAADLFERAGTLVELVRTPGMPPMISRVREARLQELLSRHCDFVLRDSDGKLRSVAPPRWTTRAILARRNWPELPRLEDSAPEPTVMSDAELLTGLDSVLRALGGQGTAREITDLLAAEPRRFPELNAVFERLALDPDDRVAPAALGYRLRQLKDRPVGDRVLIEARRTARGVDWAVDRIPSTQPEPKEESKMTEDLWDSRGPSAADLKVLERLGHHRRAFEAVEPRSEHQIAIRDRLLRLIDDMEECLCEEGLRSPALAANWKVIDQLETRYWDDGARQGANVVPILASEPAAGAEPAEKQADGAPRPKAA